MSNRQKMLDQKLPDYDSTIIIRKTEVAVRDIRALTVANNCEYALFTRGSQRMIIRGDAHSVNVGSLEGAAKLNQQGWRWSLHTHPGDSFSTVASKGDRLILRQFDQKQSVVYNIKGDYQVFRKE